MTLVRSHQVRLIAPIVFILIFSKASIGQTSSVPARVTQPVEVEQVVTLQGNTHPLARAEFDQGVAPDSLPMERMLLVLQRSAEQDAALHKLLDEQQTKWSPNYHLWLTPEQFGQQFGPADADIQAVTDWLSSQGFEVNRVAAGRTVIEFSGTAGTVRQALHTEMHKFSVNGEEHWANASDPKIPAALRPVVAGFASLNNFPRKSMLKRLGGYSKLPGTGYAKPLLTGSSNYGNYYALGPTDFATIYNVLPLWQASPAIDGTGQTIAIVASSNIDIQDVRDFRNLFGLPAKDPQIIVNGVDPGVTVEESEADLDTEWSGAVAKNATIDLVVSEDTESSPGADLSAIYIVDNNLAPILSSSYGACELFLGVGGNAFYNSLWEQGAAQGITVLVAAGDGGSALCDEQSGLLWASQGLTVSGAASTPFNVAVGGTDFSDVNAWSTYWSSSNNATTQASALSYIPETTWNDTCARSGIAGSCANAGGDPEGIDVVAGSGGQSNCLTSTGTFPDATCGGGYPKPAWQTGTGVPGDAVRDLPDVSLFASNGMNGSFYVVCQADAIPTIYSSCNAAGGALYFMGFGGTSASAPAFAGIMALVNQQTKERQGNANYVLYPLAAKRAASCASTASMAGAANTSTCVFYDVQTGNNSVACAYDTPNCSSRDADNTNTGFLEVDPPTNPLPAWSTNPGYDLATGLGSVNTANLVKNWSSVSFNPSKTTLVSLSPTTLTHGQPATFTVNVAPGSGSGTLTGDVSLIAQTGPSSTKVTGIGPFTLSGGTVTGTTSMLPGGTYGVTAHYAGNGTYGASDSTPPVRVTVSPETSQAHVTLLTFDPATGAESSSNATSVQYGTTFEILRVDVTNSSGQECAPISNYACPTGQATFSNNGQSLDGVTYTLNSEGFTEDQLVNLGGGSNSVVASYSGDSSYKASTSAADVITVTPAWTTTSLNMYAQYVVGNEPVEAYIRTTSYGFGIGPTGTVQFSVDGAPFGNAVPVQGTAYSPATRVAASGTAQTSVPLTAGTHNIAVQYSGDANYAASNSGPITIAVTDFSVSVNPATIKIATPGQPGGTTLSLTPIDGYIGTVNLSVGSGCPPYSKCVFALSKVSVGENWPATVIFTVSTAGNTSTTPPVWQRPVHPGFRFLPGWGRVLGLLLALALTWAVAARRRRAELIFATTLLLVGIWVACGGGGSSSSSTPPSAPVATLSAASLTFGQQSMGTTSAPQSVTLANTGNATLNLAGIALVGSNAADFGQSNSCSTSVAAGANCPIKVTFTPTATGTRNASLQVSDNASGSPQIINLSGTGNSPATPAGTYTVTLLATDSGGIDSHSVQVTVNVQ